MIGKAHLTLSKENIIEAVQQWLDKQWTVDSPVVTDIWFKANGMEYQPNGVVLHLESNKSFVGVTETPP